MLRGHTNQDKMVEDRNISDRARAKLETKKHKSIIRRRKMEKRLNKEDEV